MKLFDDFEAVLFAEENLILITDSGYLYYIYNPECKHWRKHRNAGNDRITVKNYSDISRADLIKAMGGIFPTKETDFMRLCNSSQLNIGNMMDLLKDDFQEYMSDYEIFHNTHILLLESNICYKSFERLSALFDKARTNTLNHTNVIQQIKQLSFEIIGRDIYKREIGIVDGRDSSSYFWIMPVRIIDYENTSGIDSAAEMRSAEISIEEFDVAQYLTPFLFKYFDGELEANKKRVEECWEDENGKHCFGYVQGFDWYLTPNYYTFEAITSIVADMRATIVALSNGHENEYTEQLKANSSQENSIEVELIIDFYQRLIYRIEYMLKVGAEKGHDLISVMGP